MREIPEGIFAQIHYGLTTRTPNGRRLDKPSLRTTATLTDIDCNAVSQGYALLGPKDHFDAGIGQEIALGRALKRYDAKLKVQEAELTPEAS